MKARLHLGATPDVLPVYPLWPQVTGLETTKAQAQTFEALKEGNTMLQQLQKAVGAGIHSGLFATVFRQARGCGYGAQPEGWRAHGACQPCCTGCEHAHTL